MQRATVRCKSGSELPGWGLNEVEEELIETFEVFDCDRDGFICAVATNN